MAGAAEASALKRNSPHRHGGAERRGVETAAAESARAAERMSVIEMAALSFPARAAISADAALGWEALSACAAREIAIRQMLVLTSSSSIKQHRG